MLSKKLLIFPTSRSIRDHIAKQKNNNQFLDKSISIGDFFSKVVIPKNNQKFIDNDIRVLLLQEAIGNMDISQLGIDKSFAKLFHSSEYIFKFFQELSHEKITFDAIDTKDTYQFYKEHLTILKKLYQNYCNVLEKYDYIDSITIANNYQLNHIFLEYFDQIVLFYEGYFSKYEFEIILQISQKYKLTLELHTNRFNQKNQKLFNDIGFELQADHHYILDMQNKKVIQKIKKEKNKLIHTIYPVTQRLDQIAVVKSAIVDMVNKGLEPQNIAIILPDEKFYTYLQMFDNEKYFNFAMGNNIYNTIFYKKAKTIYDYLNNEEPIYTHKIEFNGLEKHIIDQQIKPNWKKQLTQKLFFDLFDTLLQSETNETFKEKLLELRLSLENLLFNKLQTNQTIRLQDGYKIFIQKLAAITLDDVRSGKVTVLGILETRHVVFDGIIIIDFNDHLIPKRSIKDKFISSKIKEHVGLPNSLDRQNLQKYYYQRIMENAKNIVISYVDNEENSMSRFINQLFENPNIKRYDFTPIITSNHNLSYMEKEIVLDMDLSKLQWSASGLKTYLTCKRKYYLQSIKKIKEHNLSLEPQSFEIGQIIHTILQKVIEKNPYYKFEDIEDGLLYYQKQNPYFAFELELWKKRLKKFYQVDQTLRNNNTTPKYFERYFKTTYEGIVLQGKIDRIDCDPFAKYTIYDYKTSKNLKIDTKNNYLDTKDFQLEFYYLLAREYHIQSVAYFDLYEGKIKEETMFLEKLELLKKHINQLKTKTVNFSKCDDQSQCQLCPYKTICNR